ncbi:MAG TPA: hypothetical protein VF857_06420 [Spirochaetota bacterium]
MDFTDDIKQILKNTSQDSPIGIKTLIQAVDARQRMIISYGELVHDLQFLFDANFAGQKSPSLFYKLKADEKNKGPFRIFSEDEFAISLIEYQSDAREFVIDDTADDNDDEKYGFLKVTIRWKLSHDEMPEIEDEDIVDDFTLSLENELAKTSVAEVNGYEMTPGFVDIVVYGGETDKNTDDVYRAVTAVYKKWEIPSGSYIIKHYADKEVISDKVK